MSSEGSQPPVGNGPVPEPPPPPPAEAKAVEPGEEWIEEYEAEKDEPVPEPEPKRKKKSRRGLVWGVVAVVVVVLLVLWTYMSPAVQPVAGHTYTDSPTYANLGSYEGPVEVRWFLELVHVSDTTWGVSVSGDENVSVGQPATFHVLVTKVSEDVRNPWFTGTSVDLKKVEMYTVDGVLLGSMVSESSEPFGPMAEVEATFDSPGEYECEVFVQMTINGKMVIGYMPVNDLRVTVELDVLIVAS